MESSRSNAQVILTQIGYYVVQRNTQPKWGEKKKWYAKWKQMENIVSRFGFSAISLKKITLVIHYFAIDYNFFLFFLLLYFVLVISTCRRNLTFLRRRPLYAMEEFVDFPWIFRTKRKIFFGQTRMTEPPNCHRFDIIYELRSHTHTCRP